MSKPTVYTDMRLAPSPVTTKSLSVKVTLAIGGGAAPAPVSPVSVWNGVAWVALPAQGGS